MEDKIQAYRQPMVTATGIILGFILNFAQTWVRNESALGDGWAYAVGVSLVLGTCCLIVVLYRILQMGYSRPQAEVYYQNTLRLLITGIVLAFIGVFIDMSSQFMME